MLSLPFVIRADSIQPWWTWGFWTSPMMYGQNAIVINEFLDPRWGTVSHSNIVFFGMRNMNTF